jgi:hypothetical protein
MAENDYPVPSYLADVFKVPEGWIETPESSTDTKTDSQSVYAIDCEMVRAFRSSQVSYIDDENSARQRTARR